jgi:hypothetical protein
VADPLHEKLRRLLPDKVRQKIPEKWQPPAWRAPVNEVSPWAGPDLEWNPGDPAEVPTGAHALADAKGRDVEHYVPPGTQGKVVAIAEGFVVFFDGQAAYQLLKSDVRSLVPKKKRKWATRFPQLLDAALRSKKAASSSHYEPDMRAAERHIEMWMGPAHQEFAREQGLKVQAEFRIVPIEDVLDVRPFSKERTENALAAMKAGKALPPINVVETRGRLFIEDGQHRIEASKLLGYTHVPAVVRWEEPLRTAQYAPVVYHGSREPDLEELEAGFPPYAGGIGGGVYVAFDPEVAAFYGPHVYELSLKIPEAEIFWLTPETIDYSLGEALPNSVLVGEQVLPFSFDLNGQRYSVVSDEREALETLAKTKLIAALRAHGDWEAFGEHLEASPRWLDADDAFEYLSDGFVEQGFDVEQAEAKARSMADWYRGVAEQAWASAEQQLGTAIDLSEIGGEVAAAGYRAVYLEGVRVRGPVDSELLVFDPVDLQMIGLEREAAGLPAVGQAAREVASLVAQRIEEAQEKYEIRPRRADDREMGFLTEPGGAARGRAHGPYPAQGGIRLRPREDGEGTQRVGRCYDCAGGALGAIDRRVLSTRSQADRIRRAAGDDVDAAARDRDQGRVDHGARDSARHRLGLLEVDVSRSEPGRLPVRGAEDAALVGAVLVAADRADGVGRQRRACL